jgi:hypothetical protein
MQQKPAGDNTTDPRRKNSCCNLQPVRTLAAWLSGHRISLRDSRSGFESHQGIGFFIAMVLCVFDLICIVCEIKREKKTLAKKYFLKEEDGVSFMFFIPDRKHDNS